MLYFEGLIRRIMVKQEIFLNNRILLGPRLFQKPSERDYLL